MSEVLATGLQSLLHFLLILYLDRPLRTSTQTQTSNDIASNDLAPQIYFRQMRVP